MRALRRAVSEELHCSDESLDGQMIPGTEAHCGTLASIRDASSSAKFFSMSAKLSFIL